MDGGKLIFISGFGIGIIFVVFVVYGIDIIVVEIDFVVYEFVFEYFQFFKNYIVVIEDVVIYIFCLVVDEKGQCFDYIVYDVFIGGVEFIFFFIFEFFQNLNVLFKLNGVIVIVCNIFLFYFC